MNKIKYYGLTPTMDVEKTKKSWEDWFEQKGFDSLEELEKVFKSNTPEYTVYSCLRTNKFGHVMYVWNWVKDSEIMKQTIKQNSNNRINTHATNLNDEIYTPAHLITPLLKYLNDYKDKIIWCPFDTEKSEFVKVLKENGFKVVYSHIATGQDFLEYEPKEWDIIISNPPFSLKFEIFERVFNFKKPFILLMGVPMENYGTLMQLWNKYNYQPYKMSFNYRPSFDGNPSAFMVNYYSNILFNGKSWVMENINKKEWNKSEMYKESK